MNNVCFLLWLMFFSSISLLGMEKNDESNYAVCLSVISSTSKWYNELNDKEKKEFQFVMNDTILFFQDEKVLDKNVMSLTDDTKDTLKKLCLLYSNTTNRDISGAKSNVTESINMLSELMNSRELSFTVKDWCIGFNKLTKTDYMQDYRAPLILYKNNPMFCISVWEHSPLLQQYISTLQKISANIKPLEEFLLINDSKNIELLQTIKQEIDNDYIMLKVTPDLDCLNTSLHKLYELTNTLTVQCFLILKNKFAFSISDQTMIFEEFVHNFVQSTIHNTILFGTTNADDMVEEEAKKFFDQKNIDLPFLISMYLDDYKDLKTVLKPIILKNVLMPLKDMIPEYCKESKIIKEAELNFFKKPLCEPIVNLKIKEDAKAYNVLRLWALKRDYIIQITKKSNEITLQRLLFITLLNLVEKMHSIVTKNNNKDLLEVRLINFEKEINKNIYFNNNFEKEYINQLSKLHFKCVKISHKHFLKKNNVETFCDDIDIHETVRNENSIQGKTIYKNCLSILKSKIENLFEDISFLESSTDKKRLEKRVDELRKSFTSKYFAKIGEDELKNCFIAQCKEYLVYKDLCALLHNSETKKLIESNALVLLDPNTKESTTLTLKSVQFNVKSKICVLFEQLKRKIVDEKIVSTIDDMLTLLRAEKEPKNDILFNLLTEYQNIKKTVENNCLNEEEMFNKYSQWAQKKGLLLCDFDIKNKSILYLKKHITIEIDNIFNIFLQNNISCEIKNSIEKQQELLTDGLSLKDLVEIYNTYLHIRNLHVNQIRSLANETLENKQSNDSPTTPFSWYSKLHFKKPSE